MGTSEHAAIQAVLAGDRDAYGALVVRYSPSVFRVAYRITANEADAEDVVQEAFIRGYQKIATFESRADFGTWIYRIAVNCALDVAAKKRRAPQEYRIAEESDSEAAEVQVADVAAGPERLLLSREVAGRQEALLEKLTPNERTAFVLRHLEDRTTAEIADLMGLTQNAVKQVVFRAVQKLRRGMASLRGN